MSQQSGSLKGATADLKDIIKDYNWKDTDIGLVVPEGTTYTDEVVTYDASAGVWPNQTASLGSPGQWGTAISTGGGSPVSPVEDEYERLDLTGMLTPLARRLNVAVEPSSDDDVEYNMDGRSLRLLVVILNEILKRTDIALPPMQEEDLIGALMGAKEAKDDTRG